MGHGRWTTDDEKDWLEARVHSFRAALSANTSTSWLTGTWTEYFDVFPQPDPTEQEIQKAGDVEKAKDKLETGRKKVSVLVARVIITCDLPNAANLLVVLEPPRGEEAQGSPHRPPTHHHQAPATAAIPSVPQAPQGAGNAEDSNTVQGPS